MMKKSRTPEQGIEIYTLHRELTMRKAIGRRYLPNEIGWKRGISEIPLFQLVGPKLAFDISFPSQICCSHVLFGLCCLFKGSMLALALSRMLELDVRFLLG
ncbi:hypothetical protein BJX76DRAFT_324073 [Aspergillus varians]